MHDLLQHLLGTRRLNADGDRLNQGVLIAVIGAMGGVFAAGVTAMAGLVHREPASESEVLSTQSLIDQARRAERERDTARALNHRYETWLWRHGVDPATITASPGGDDDTHQP